MCNYKVLHNNQHGYVVRCGSCGYVQVAFGTTCMALTLSQFGKFRQLVAKCGEMQGTEAACATSKCIHIPTPAKAMTMVCTVRELQQLTELLEHADACLQVEQLLALPNT